MQFADTVQAEELHVTLFLPPEGPCDRVLYLWSSPSATRSSEAGVHGILDLDEDARFYDKKTRIPFGPKKGKWVRACADEAALWVYAIVAFIAHSETRVDNLPEICCGGMPVGCTHAIAKKRLTGPVSDLVDYIHAREAPGPGGGLRLAYGVLRGQEPEIVAKRWKQIELEAESRFAGPASHGTLSLLMSSGVGALGGPVRPVHGPTGK